VERSITIYKSPEDLYRFWRNLENLPRFMTQHAEIRQLDERRSHWKVNSLGGATFEWDAEIIKPVSSAPGSRECLDKNRRRSSTRILTG
jgi:uncharacterized membrane protein